MTIIRPQNCQRPSLMGVAAVPAAVTALAVELMVGYPRISVTHGAHEVGEAGRGLHLATVLMRSIISSTALSTGTLSVTMRLMALAQTFSLFSTVNL